MITDHAIVVAGEVRAHELKVIGDLIQRHMSADIHGVILNGDLNIDVRARNILKGQLRSIIGQKELAIDTGFSDSEGLPQPVLRWGRKSIADAMCADNGPSDSNNKEIKQGYCNGGGSGSSSGDTREVELIEAFASVHGWGEGVGSDKQCTSLTPHRCSWIDMVWFSPTAFRVTELSDMTAPSTFIPNEKHGSDHLPLSVMFEIATN
jgi:hypothetical protein